MKKWLFPKPRLLLFAIPSATILLLLAFLYLDEQHPLRFLAYLFSAYTCLITCIRAYLCFQQCHDFLMQKPLIQRYRQDVAFHTHISLMTSLGINLCYVMLKLVSGIRNHSVWLITLAIYYAILAIMRFMLLYHSHHYDFGKNLISEYRKSRQCGIMLLMMNVVLSGITIMAIKDQEAFHYPGYFIYVMALYTFYQVIGAIINLVRYRHFPSPVINAVKVINMAAALVSLLALETAMLEAFSQEQTLFFNQLMTGLTGALVCLIILCSSLMMIRQATKQINQRRNEDD